MKYIDIIKKNVHDNFKKNPVEIIPLPNSGSRRIYYRVVFDNRSIIAVYNKNIKENTAFVQFTNHFIKKGLNVPKIIAYNLNEDVYFIEDLGDDCLYNRISEEQKSGSFSNELFKIYKKVIDELIRFQVDGSKGFNYSHCYPVKEFNKDSILWDLNYFKYYYLKLTLDLFDEELLHDEFERLADFLLQPESKFFMYRDFQTRNILLKDNKMFFIDYQGGRKGPLQYDLASLLFQAKANIPDEIRKKLYAYYIEKVNKKIDVDKELFKKYYFGFVLIRILQTLGAYGFRGFYEKKGHFITSIPFAIENAITLSKKVNSRVKLPYLLKLLNKSKEYLPVIQVAAPDRLRITINSFSYKKTGIPVDYSGNGGGFVFDCRALPNPYQNKELKYFTGKDKPVIDFFENLPELKNFIRNAYNLVEPSIKEYIERGFTNLNVSFGCTGGHHRSVYCADKLAAAIHQKFNVDIVLFHHELKANNL